MRRVFWWIIVTAALLWGGGQHLYTALRNRSPTVVECAELMKGLPKAEWLRVRGCALDLANGGYQRLGDEVFVSLRPPAAEEDTPVRLVLATKDAEVRRVITMLRDADKTKPETLKPLLAHMEAHGGRLQLEREVEGLVQFGIELKDSRKRGIAEVVEHLEPEFAILKEGDRPAVVMGAVMFFLGLLSLGFLVRFALRGAGTPAAS